MELKLLNKDILIKPENKNDYVDTPIILLGDNKKDDINFYKVIVVSHRVTMIKPDDIVLLENGHHTIPMMWNNKWCAITDESEVVGILEDV